MARDSPSPPGSPAPRPSRCRGPALVAVLMALAAAGLAGISRRGASIHLTSHDMRLETVPLGAQPAPSAGEARSEPGQESPLPSRPPHLLPQATATAAATAAAETQPAADARAAQGAQEDLRAAALHEPHPLPRAEADIHLTAPHAQQQQLQGEQQQSSRGSSADAPRRLVAVGDLHGDLDVALSLLRALKLVDSQGRWDGGAATLVQTGDLMDRGPNSSAVVEAFRGWQEQAKGQAKGQDPGGAVVTLLGNHEVLNLQGDLRYVHPGEFALHGGRRQWRRDWSPLGERGRALLASHPAAAVAGEGQCRSLFVHAGLLPEFLDWWPTLEALNRAAKDALATPGQGESAGSMGVASGSKSGTRAVRQRRRMQEALLSDSGPFWLRGYAEQPESEVCGRVAEVLRRVGESEGGQAVHRMLLGHTPQEAIRTRCNGTLVLLDTGMSGAYGGQAQAWSCMEGEISVLGLEGPAAEAD